MGQRDYLEGGIGSNLHRVRVNFIVRIIAKIKREFNRSVKILDIGCGDGTVTKYILEVCDSDDIVTGIDIDETNIIEAISYCPNAR